MIKVVALCSAAVLSGCAELAYVADRVSEFNRAAEMGLDRYCSAEYTASRILLIDRLRAENPNYIPVCEVDR